MNRWRAIVAALLALVLNFQRLDAAETAAQRLGGILKRADYFSVWGWGVAAATSENERTFRVFMQQNPVVDDALRLIADGTPAAKAYGFLALNILSPELFAKLASRFFSNRRDGVSIRSGCSPSTESLGKLVKGIADGTICLPKHRE
ncbi:hypothetical protein LBMAG57_31990 [Verrucomicrobiota bacterium]|nr:hypothetical protein LBMAG57_31990 [Verrucomicrobiota bacterium]